jgi:hypothetical protein
VRGALRSLVGQIDALDEAIGAIDRELAASVKADETAKRLVTIPGVGPVTASAIMATIQDAGAFASGREFAAFLGLTPRQNSLMSIPRLAKRSSTLCSDSGCRTYIITTRRITSGELLKYRNGCSWPDASMAQTP